VGSLPLLSINNPNQLFCYPNPNSYSISLTASGASAYKWMPGNNSNAGILVSPTVTTIYTVTGANSTCSTSAVTTISVAANFSIAVVASNTFVCFGDNTTISVLGASSYVLLPNIAGTGSALLTPTVNTTYTFTGANGYCRDTKSISIFVNPDFYPDMLLSTDSVCAGQVIDIMGLSTINFTVNPGNISGVNPAIVSPLANTIYTITTSNNGTCFKDTVIAVAAKDCSDVGIRQHELKEVVLIYPIPTSTRLLIETQLSFETLEVLNILGSKVYAQQINGLKKIAIDIEQWAKGVYFVKLYNDLNHELVKKIVVE